MKRIAPRGAFRFVLKGKYMDCESKNHPKSECKGYLWECEKCKRKFCYQERDSENNLCDECTVLNEITIRIYESVDEPGYFYDIFDTVLDDDTPAEIAPIESGHCTTAIENALEMAYEQAKVMIANSK